MSLKIYQKRGKFGWWIEFDNNNNIIYLVGKNFNLPEEKEE